MALCCRRIFYALLLLVTVLVLYSSPVCSDGSDATSVSNANAGSSDDTIVGGASESSSFDRGGNKPDDANEKPERSPKVNARRTSTSSSSKEDDWGSFYDPKNIFCGKYDCYKILGFDYETWGREPPSLKDITKSYRSLSRRWHPDKNKAKGAREKFVVSWIGGSDHSCFYFTVSTLFSEPRLTYSFIIRRHASFLSTLDPDVDQRRRPSPKPTKSSPTSKNVPNTTISATAPTNTTKNTAPPSSGPTLPNRTPP